MGLSIRTLYEQQCAVLGERKWGRVHCGRRTRQKRCSCCAGKTTEASRLDWEKDVLGAPEDLGRVIAPKQQTSESAHSSGQVMQRGVPNSSLAPNSAPSGLASSTGHGNKVGVSGVSQVEIVGKNWGKRVCWIFLAPGSRSQGRRARARPRRTIRERGMRMENMR